MPHFEIALSVFRYTDIIQAPRCVVEADDKKRYPPMDKNYMLPKDMPIRFPYTIQKHMKRSMKSTLVDRNT